MLIEWVIKLSRVFNHNPQRSWLREWSKSRWWNCVQTDTNNCKIKNWKERL